MTSEKGGTVLAEVTQLLSPKAEKRRDEGRLKKKGGGVEGLCSGVCALLVHPARLLSVWLSLMGNGRQRQDAGAAL